MRRVDRLPSDADALPAGAQVILGNPYQRGPGGAIAPVRGLMVEAVIVAKANKYGAQRTWSELCQRTFASKWEAERGEQLFLLEKARQISGLVFQPKWTLCVKPKITYAADFSYRENLTVEGHPYGRMVYEDCKGVLTREQRVKLAWLKEKHGIEVKLITRKGGK